MEELEHQAHEAAPEPAALRVPEAGEVLSPQAHPPFARSFDAGGDMEQGALPAARTSGDRNGFAGLDLQADGIDDRQFRPVRLGVAPDDPVEFQDRAHPARMPRTPVPGGHHLGHHRERDLVRGARTDRQPDGRRNPRQGGFRNAALPQAAQPGVPGSSGFPAPPRRRRGSRGPGRAPGRPVSGRASASRPRCWRRARCGGSPLRASRSRSRRPGSARPRRTPGADRRSPGGSRRAPRDRTAPARCGRRQRSPTTRRGGSRRKTPGRVRFRSRAAVPRRVPSRPPRRVPETRRPANPEPGPGSPRDSLPR